MPSFTLSIAQDRKLYDWVLEQNKKAIEAQKENPPNISREILESCWEEGFPYGGAVGGSLTYSFTPTSLGVCVKVTDAFTKETIDLTEYEDW